MTRFVYPVLTAALVLGCNSLKGPNQSYLAPAVEGRVVDAVSGEPVKGARVERHLAPPSATDPFTEKGATKLKTVPTVKTDDEGRFRAAPVKGAYLLLTRSSVYELTLVIRHSDHQPLTTNVDLLTIRPVRTNEIPTVFVGDLPLNPESK